ncbi:MAG: GNAT family N-acetyltransferase [Alphaproteobacteria bacterium]|nr:MAG: GNAT family N-acetyltransferase [Alphaproteobacteria bacterium]
MPAQIIRIAGIKDQQVLRDQLDDYLEELRAFAPVEATYPYFEGYWTEPERWPYVIEVDRGAIGFAFVNRWSPSGRGTDYAVAEFYVAPGWRGRGHGTEAACQVFRKHCGQWEIAFDNGNLKARAFWPRAIMKAGVAAFERIESADRTILRFSNG